MITTTLFPLGETIMTGGVAATFNDPASLAQLGNALREHAAGRWGEIDEEDRDANDHALGSGERVLSAYVINGVKVWILTEADRSVTTILLPSEY